MRALFTLATLAAAAALTGCAVIVVPGDGDAQVHGWSMFDSSGVQGNGQVMHEARAIEMPTAVQVDGQLRLDVRVGGAPGLEIEADSNLMPLVRSDSSNGTLHLWIDGRVSSHDGIRAVLHVPQLNRLQAGGSGRIVVEGLNGGPLVLANSGSAPIQLAGRVGALDVNVSGSGSVNAQGLDSGNVNASLHGSGRLTLGQVHGDAFNVEVHGSGSVSASGAVRALNARVHGSGSVQLDGLTSEAADLSSDGSGGISAAVSQRLLAQANGSGHISVRGNPQQRTVSGRHVTVFQ